MTFLMQGFQRETRVAGELGGTKIASMKTMSAGAVKALGDVVTE
ncbi:hypothetical protein [Polaromonas sp.]|nr:hypothetical protein [Polaromonas sp.]